MDHSAILKWAAGSNKPLPIHLEYDEDILVDLVNIHNLSGRFVQRLKENDAPTFTPKLVSAIYDLNSQTKKRVIQNMNAVSQINQQLPSTSKIIVIKGFSTYLLVGKESTIRFGDIDILSSDTEVLLEVLNKMNYRQTRPSFLHEIGEYTRDAIELDIHDHFPVYFYPDSLLNADLNPFNNLGVWCQDYNMKKREIKYDDLIKNSIQVSVPNSTDIRVADPNILTIIICAHAFMNYTNIWSISHRVKAYVRLGEIADLFDLVNHPSFDSKRFFSLLRQFDALDAVEWAANITSMLFGNNPLPVTSTINLDEELPINRFPRCLWWNFWASIQSGTDELIQKCWLSMDWLTQQVGSNVLFTERGTTGKYATIKCGSSRLLQRFITQNIDPIQVVLEVNVTKMGLSVCIKVLSDLKVDTDRIRIDFGHKASEWICSANSQDYTLVGTTSVIFLSRQGTSYEIYFNYSWKTLGDNARNAKKIALLIGIGKQSICDGLIASVLIPLIINFDI